MTTCKTCGAPILWAKTARGSIPLDPDPRPGGNIDLEGRVAIVRKPDKHRPGYVSHFTSCADAAKHRRARAAEDDGQGDLFAKRGGRS